MTVGNVAEVTSHKISWPIVEKANFFFIVAQQPKWDKASSLSRIYDHIQTSPLGRTPLDE
jgi:hypothetical protein